VFGKVAFGGSGISSNNLQPQLGLGEALDPIEPEDVASELEGVIRLVFFEERKAEMSR
jgi:hypothetical protein